MQFVLGLLFEIVIDVVCYGVGRSILLIVAPHYGVESHDVAPRRPWKWRGWSFAHDGKRYFYTETVEVLGALVVIALVILVVLANYLRS